MNRRNATSLFLLFMVALLATMFARHAPGQGDEPRAKPVEKETQTSRRQLVGTTSCSASVCHGGGVIGEKGSEATTWLALDPHARAYDALLTPRSQRMAKHLWGDKTAAHEAPLCLKCHVHPQYDRARPNFRRADGVGCESCHGPAQDWLTPHYRKSAEPERERRATDLGMAHTKFLDARAEICVTCHVGTPDANVDHDLIAAGHPALRFEFATYLSNLPPHWDVANDKRANSPAGAHKFDFAGIAWSTGQRYSSAAALELLAYRADPANGKPWPEFAALDCFSCHHDLQPASWRQGETHLKGRRPGALALSRWYDLWTAGDYSPNRMEVAKKARQASQSVRRGLMLLPGFMPTAVSPWAVFKGEDRSWDEATQRYLAAMTLRAMRIDNRQPVEPELEKLITKLRTEVTFPPDYDSPLRFVPK